MKQLLVILCCVFFSFNQIKAQSPMQEFWALNQNVFLLDQAAPTIIPSFAFSLRKLRRSYTGFSIKVRRRTDNAEANVAFDGSGIVSTNSEVTVTAVGSSALTLGSKINFSTFKGVQRLFVTTWYDQGINAYHALQTTASSQPELLMNTSGAGSTKPSLSFNGSLFLRINQPIQNIVASGVNGTFLLGLRTTSNTNHFAFGYRNSSTDWRWAFHINWSDGYCYFDAAEVCCATSRSYVNSANVNAWKQYSFIRGTTYKTARLSGVATVISSSSAPSATQTGGQFDIGSTFNKPTSDGMFQGNMTEVIMFPTDLSITILNPLEQNQIKYWNL